MVQIYDLTENQALALNALTSADGPASAYSLLDRLREHGIIAFAICDCCGQVDEFSDMVIAKRLTGWAREHSFKLANTTIELRGTCANCMP
ncbi:hypothetical protein [Stappia sp. ICDLI1TA098]